MKTREEMINDLLANEMDMMDRQAVAEMILNGCQGLDELTDQELAALYAETFEEETKS